jgi:hypothetical protein
LSGPLAGEVARAPVNARWSRGDLAVVFGGLASGVTAAATFKRESFDIAHDRSFDIAHDRSFDIAHDRSFGVVH